MSRESSTAPKGRLISEKNRPTEVAEPVASATGRNVRAPTSGSNSSTAKSTPPIGVLKVAAIAAPVPDATRMMRCRGRYAQQLSERGTERRSDLNDRPLAAD